MEEESVGPDLILTTERANDTLSVAVQGDLDAYSAPGLEEAVSGLLGEPATTVVLDLSATSFIDSSGLRTLLTAQRQLADDGKTMVLRTPSESVLRILDITGLSGHFGIQP